MSKILILDANHRAALAATRSLGSKKIHVVVADEIPRTLSASSKYCQESFVYTSPYACTEEFIENIRQESMNRGIATILPISDMTTHLLLKNRDKLLGINIPYVDFEKYEALTDKMALCQLANKLKINIPKTYFINASDDLNNLYSELQFPMVLKPYRSRVLLEGTWTNTSVKYATSAQHLKSLVKEYPYFNRCPFLLQEYIRGRGQGLFALYNHAQPIVFFSHQRLREKPPSGGVSVLSESIPLDPQLYNMGRRLLDYMQWHGVAMIEFKVAQDGTPYLMEVNARFWGSLQLAIDAGVDFPWLLYKLSVGQSLDNVSNYTVGVRSRWLLGDFIALVMLLSNRNSAPHMRYRDKCRVLFQFMNFFQHQTRYDINRWDDFLPSFFELKQYLSRKLHGGS